MKVWCGSSNMCRRNSMDEEKESEDDQRRKGKKEERPSQVATRNSTRERESEGEREE